MTPVFQLGWCHFTKTGNTEKKSEFGDNEFDFSAFELEVTRRHPDGDLSKRAQEKAQD